MAYYLAVETNPHEYTALKLKSSKPFGPLEENEDPYACGLEEIEGYTILFENHHTLTKRLASNGILQYRDLFKPLAIFYVNGIEVRKLKGDILYKESADYVYFPSLIYDYILEQGKNRNSHFFRKLSQTLDSSSITRYMATQLANIIEKEKQYEKSSLFNRLKSSKPIVDDNLIENIANTLLYPFTLGDDGNLVYKNEVSREKLHEIAAFITEYEKTYPKEQRQEITRKRKIRRK